MDFNEQVIHTFLKKYEMWQKNLEDGYKDKKRDVINKRKEFMTKYGTKAKVLKMTLYDYAPNNNPSSFCHYIERDLHDYGGMGGWPLSNFGITYDNKTNEYKYKNRNARHSKYGDTLEEAFENIKKAIADLYDEIDSNNIEHISDSILSPVFKNKLTYIRKTDNWIGCYSNNDLNVILSIFDIAFDTKEDEVHKRCKLFEFYKEIKRRYPKINTFDFSAFLYTDAGYYQIIKSDDAKNYNVESSNKIQMRIVSNFKRIESHESSSKRGLVTINIDREKEKKLTGNKGEQIVLDYLNKHKKQLKIKGDVFAACRENDSLHYDFSYETVEGETIYIEVKATKNNSSNITFNISEGELKFYRQNKDNYFICYVNNVNNCSNIVLIKGKDIMEYASPIEYKVNVSCIVD